MNKLMILATALLLNMLWSSKALALLFCAVSATNMVFGSFSPLTGSEVVSTSNINVTCDALSSYAIALSPGGSHTVTGSFLLGGSRDHTVYGRIPLASQRTAVAGSYSDSITVTLTYN